MRAVADHIAIRRVSASSRHLLGNHSADSHCARARRHAKPQPMAPDEPSLSTRIPGLRDRLRRPPWQRGLVPLALGAGALFLLLRPEPPPRAPLPAYRVESVGLRLAMGERFELVLRPERPVGAEPGPVRGFWVTPDAPPAAWRPPAVFEPDGTLRVAGVVGEHLPHRPGGGLLVITLGAAAPLGPALVTALNGATTAGGRDWRAIAVPVDMH
jgi:hypothetical protein